MRSYESNRNLITGITHAVNASLVSGFAYQNDTLGRRDQQHVYELDLSGSSQGAGTSGGILSASFGGPASVPAVFYFYDANGNVTNLTDANC